MARGPVSLRVLAYFAAWLAPWRPVLRVRARTSGLRFFVHRRDAIGRHVAKYGEHEPAITRFIAAHLATTPPGIVIDAGANFGWHALHAAQVPMVATVAAFEPDLFNAWLLERNIAENRVEKVIVSTAALGAQSGVARLHRYKSSNLGRHSLIADTGRGSRLVPVLDLDRALDQLGLGLQPVALLKIDVEGYEPAVIAGAERALQRSAAVVLEYSRERSAAGGLSVEDMIARLRNAGLAPHSLDEAGRLVAVDSAMLRSFDRVIDLVCLRANRERAGIT